MFVGFVALSVAVSHHQNAFAAICLSEEEIPEPRIMHFDNGFDVLFDNGANVSIGISKHDFIDLEERRGSVSGVGSSTAEGIGTLHFRTTLDNGRPLDVIVPGALHAPSMDLRILSDERSGRENSFHL